ncbi:MAG: response regulator [Candidatus Nitrosopolaris wilkensis]|nr:MAG: response regulator [Candidatus Nitrosopolaris wilkensis]
MATANKIRVLIIDDNEDVTEAVSDYIESIGDSCTSVNDGKQGLEVIKKEGHNYDAIILDLAMPDFSGYQVLESLKNQGLIEPNNIIIFTASSILDKDVQELMLIGIKTILPKPLSLEHLDETINRFRH